MKKGTEEFENAWTYIINSGDIVSTNRNLSPYLDLQSEISAWTVEFKNYYVRAYLVKKNNQITNRLISSEKSGLCWCHNDAKIPVGMKNFYNAIAKKPMMKVIKN